MTLDIQFKIKNNSYYKQYLRENSYWYKLLNRTPEIFPDFEEKAKEYFSLRPTDKIQKMLQNIEMIQSIVSTLK